MVDRYVVRARIAKIREYIALLRRIRGLADESHFVRDPLIYGNAERYLQLAIQIDRHRVYAILENELGDFETFIKAVSKLL